MKFRWLVVLLRKKWNRKIVCWNIRESVQLHSLSLSSNTWNTVTKVFIRFLRWPFFKKTIIFLRKFSFYEFTDVFTTRNLTLRLHSSYSLWKLIYVTRLLNMPRIDRWRFDLCSRYLNVTFGHWIRIICKILGKYDTNHTKWLFKLLLNICKVFEFVTSIYKKLMQYVYFRSFLLFLNN